MRDAGLTPLEPYPGSNAPWRCRCKKCKSEVTPRFSTVVVRGLGGCNVCAKKAAGEKRRKKAEAEVLQSLAERNLAPLEPYKHALKPWRVQCLVCGNKFSTRGNSIQQGRGCQKCSSKRRGEQQRQKRAAKAEKVMLSEGLRPLEEYPGSHVPWPSICLKCGAGVAPRLSGVRQGQGGCRPCGVARRGESRKIPDKRAREIMKAGGVIPDAGVPYPGNKEPWPSTCITCGRRVTPSLGNIKAGNKGCKRCAMVEGGVSFDLWAPATIYLISHKRLKSLKIGITSDRNRQARLLTHRGEGWEVKGTWNVATGQQAVFVEGEILRWWREDLHESPSLTAAEMPQAGWTETIRTGVVTPSAVKKRVRTAIKDAHNLPPLPDDPREGPLRCIAERDGVQCERDAKVKNYCYVHYRRWRTFGDPWGGKWTSLEVACVIEVNGQPCGKPIRSNDMCSVHYERWYTYGDPHFMKRPTPGTRSTKCLVEIDGQNCGERVVAREMCSKHYGHWRRHGDPLAGRFENPGQQCSVFEGGQQCPRTATSRGMCGRHYNRWRQHGDPTVTLKRKAGDPIPPCTVEVSGKACGRPVHAHGMCRRHYRRAMGQ
jgi:hypothetical protein